MYFYFKKIHHNFWYDDRCSHRHRDTEYTADTLCPVLKSSSVLKGHKLAQSDVL